MVVSYDDTAPPFLDAKRKAPSVLTLTQFVSGGSQCSFRVGVFWQGALSEAFNSSTEATTLEMMDLGSAEIGASLASFLASHKW
jgi:hypothetical protein